MIIYWADIAFPSAHVMQLLKQLNALSGLTYIGVVVEGSNIPRTPCTASYISSSVLIYCFFNPSKART